MIASDIHGSAYYCEKMLEAFSREKADKLLLLGDILYHGPRNDLPRDYAPKKVIEMLNAVKENILCEVQNGSLFTVNYPLLIEHIIREAKLYRSTLEKLNNQTCLNHKDLLKTESFWNQIMMEHALFIRGLLDPSEETLIMTADDFACDFKKLLEIANERDCETMSTLTKKSLEETLQIKEFKTAGVKGILNCEIASILLPLLADHVLREANHYIRLLTCDYIE